MRFPIWRFAVLLVGGAVLAYFALAPQYGREQDMTAPQQEETSMLEMAPDFILPDRQGQEHRLLDYRGQAVVLSFWTTTCSYCLLQFEELDALQRQWGDQVQVMAINMEESPAQAEEVLESRDYQFEVLFDEGEVAEQYEVGGIPATILIHPDGQLVAFYHGYQTQETLSRRVERLLP